MSKVESLFARTVQELILAGDVGLVDLLPQNYSYNRPFENLTTLRLKLVMVNPNAQTNSSLMLTSFLRSVSPTLQLLHIDYISSLELDLSAVFNDLSQSNSESSIIIPNFKSLSLILNPATSLPSLRSLRCFLFTYHDILHHLVLKLHVGDFDGDPDEPLGQWLFDLADNCQFSSLETLDIYPTKTQTGLSALLTLIKRTAPTLSSLTIYDRCLTPKEAHQVIDALSDQVKALTKASCLRSLSMDITNLSVSTLDHCS